MKPHHLNHRLQFLTFLTLLLGTTLAPVQPCAAGPFVFSSTGSLATPRSGHTATLLPNGAVLVAGGYEEAALATTELYDPATGTWMPTGRLATARSGHRSEEHTSELQSR